MPKRKDKSFELMASIGEAKQNHSPADQQVQSEPIEKGVKPLNQTKTKSQMKSSTSNIPYVPPSLSVKKQLKRLAFEEETTMTALISEGLDHVFKDRGLKTMEQLID